jgi:hypothetical protein
MISLPLTGILGSKYKNYSGIKLSYKELSDDIKLFRKTPEQFLHNNSLYSVGEYLDFQVE